MKWSKFIQDDNKALIENSPVSRLNTSKSQTSNSGRQFTLKSIQKAKADSTLHLKKNMSTSSITSNDLKIKHLVSKYSCRPPKKDICQDFESTPNFMVGSRFKAAQSDLDQIVDRFSKQLTEFIKSFMERVESMRNFKQFRQQVTKRIINSTEQTVKRCIDQLPKLEHKNPQIRKSLSCVQNNNPHVQKQTSDKKKTRIILFKNEKVEQKNNFNKIERTFNQMSIILEKNKQQPKFVRTSRLKRDDRSCDSSVEQLMERSVCESRKIYKSRIKSKDVLYNINTILNQ